MSFSIEASNTVAIVEQVSKDAITAIKPLADELGMAAQYVFELFVRQNYVVALQYLVWVAALVIAAIVLFKIAKKIRSREDFVWTHYYGMTDEGALVTVSRIAATVLLAVSLLMFSSEIVPRMVNPHYYAIKDMVATGQGLLNK